MPVVAGQQVLTLFTAAPPFFLAPFLVLVGHKALGIAVVAFVQPLVDVHAERLVTPVMSAVVAERAEGLDETGGMPPEVNV